MTSRKIEHFMNVTLPTFVWSNCFYKCLHELHQSSMNICKIYSKDSLYDTKKNSNLGINMIHWRSEYRGSWVFGLWKQVRFTNVTGFRHHLITRHSAIQIPDTGIWFIAYVCSFCEMALKLDHCVKYFNGPTNHSTNHLTFTVPFSDTNLALFMFPIVECFRFLDDYSISKSI